MTRFCSVCAVDYAVHCLHNTMAAVGGFDMSYNVVRCGHCGFRCAKQIAVNDTFSAYYRSVSKYDLLGAVPLIDQVRVSYLK
jgi:hypothetical protein